MIARIDKNSTTSRIKDAYGAQPYNLTKSYVNISRKVRKYIAKKQFSVTCRYIDVYINSISNSTKNLLSLQPYSNSMKNRPSKLRNKVYDSLWTIVIIDIHNHLAFLEWKKLTIESQLQILLPTEIFDNIEKYQDNFYLDYNYVEKLDINLPNLFLYKNPSKKNYKLDQHNLTDGNDPWLINLSDVDIPKPIGDVLRPGENFSSEFLSSQQTQTLELIKDFENKSHVITTDYREKVRNITVTAIKTNIQKFRRPMQLDRTIETH